MCSALLFAFHVSYNDRWSGVIPNSSASIFGCSNLFYCAGDMLAIRSDCELVSFDG